MVERQSAPLCFRLCVFRKKERLKEKKAGELGWVSWFLGELPSTEELVLAAATTPDSVYLLLCE